MIITFKAIFVDPVKTKKKQKHKFSEVKLLLLLLYVDSVIIISECLALINMSLPPSV